VLSARGISAMDLEAILWPCSKPRILHSPALQRIRRLTPGLSKRFCAWTGNLFSGSAPFQKSCMID
jgi:hypothetical protein